MSIETALQQYPRVSLTRTPTPLDYLPRLSRELGLKFYLKRDDLTDLTLGGDKPRKLEYEIAQAQAAGADVLVTCGSSQSNHARLTTAAARRVGLHCAVVLSHDAWHSIQGNLLTVYLMGARVEIVHTADHWDLEQQAQALCDRLKAEGRTPHYIPVSGTTPHSCLGYVRAGLELAGQLAGQAIAPAAIYTPFGTGGIFTAMLVALREQGYDGPIIGISVNRREAQCRANFEIWWATLSDLLALNPDRERGPYDIDDRFIGREYGDPTAACLEAIIKMGHSEGILLDPVYSGKVFSGFLAHHQAGRWQPDQTVVMLHSGGLPALFAYHDVIEAHLRKRGLLA